MQGLSYHFHQFGFSMVGNFTMKIKKATAKMKRSVGPRDLQRRFTKAAIMQRKLSKPNTDISSLIVLVISFRGAPV